MQDENERGGALSQEEREFVRLIGALVRRIRVCEEQVAALVEARQEWRALLAETVSAEPGGEGDGIDEAGEVVTAEPGEEGDGSIDDAGETESGGGEAEARQSSAAAPVENACNSGYERSGDDAGETRGQGAKVGRRFPSYRHFSDEALLAAVQQRLREMAREGIAPNQLEWDDLRGSELPTRGGVIKRLKTSWAEIVAGAGLQIAGRANLVTRVTAPREIESESVYADLVETIRQPGQADAALSVEALRAAVNGRLATLALGPYGPSCTMWDAQRGELPTTSTITKRLGVGWREVLAGAGLRARPAGTSAESLAAKAAVEMSGGEGEGERLHRAAAMPLGALEPLDPDLHEYGLPVLRSKERNGRVYHELR